ncbi:ubiquitin-like domain-containing protein [Angustibacter sp. McL0619]|uniref:ubiquitin-like domain-containing protein n=1 Tax=Angustibacter sp. McL0619 TaxID=3415676 RepID=UPI003CF94819
MISRPTRLLIQGLTLAGVVASTVAFASFDKSVDLVVDGQHRNVHAFGDTVQDVLSSEGVQVGGHDIVSPAPAAKIHDGSDVVVRYGRQLYVTIDGRERSYWTTALNVDEALTQLGLRADSARLSVSRSLPLGRQALHMDLDTQKSVALVVGGKQAREVTYASTVGELLAEAHVRPGALDKLSAPLTRPLVNGATVRLDRVTQRHVFGVSKVAFATRSTKTDALEKGTTKVTTKGKAGKAKVTYLSTYVNGKLTAKKVLTRVVVSDPVTQVEQVGTKKPTAGPIPAGSGGGLNWAALAQCESGGNPRAVNPAGYYGLYQFSLSTWHGVGGAGNPIDASPAEQTARAQALYARGGSGQWGCGSHLYD